jgi:hypothetical protein
VEELNRYIDVQKVKCQVFSGKAEKKISVSSYGTHNSVYQKGRSREQWHGTSLGLLG